MNPRKRVLLRGLLVVMVPMLLIEAVVISLWNAVTAGVSEALLAVWLVARQKAQHYAWLWAHAGWTQAEVNAEELARARSRFPAPRTVHVATESEGTHG